MSHIVFMVEFAHNKSVPITLEYDRGTIVVGGLPAPMVERLGDLILWDQRVDVWRAPAHRYLALTRSLRAHSAAFNDHVRKLQHLDGQWNSVALRPYQEAALLAWRAASGRGLICLPTGAGKTRIALAAIQRSGKSTLCLVPTRVLMHQRRFCLFLLIVTTTG